MEEDDTVTFNYWYIGVALAIFGCFVDATGWVTEKKSHNYLRESHQRLGKEYGLRYLCHCRWWCGFILHTVGTLIFNVSLGLGKQTLITPLQSFSLLFNAILAWKYLNEKLNKLQIIGTATCVIGCAGAVAFGPRDKATIHNAFQLEIYFRNASFLVFSLSITVIYLMNYAIYKWYHISNKYYLMFCEIGFSAYYGSWSALFTKCTVEIFGTTAAGFTRNWEHWLPYVTLISIIITAVSLEYWRQEALKSYPGSYVGSIYNTEITVAGICFGAFFFSEFEETPILYIILFVVSVTVSLSGVGMLAIGDDVIKGDTQSSVKELMMTDLSNNICESENTSEITSEMTYTSDFTQIAEASC